MPKQKCGRCTRPVEFAEGMCVANKTWHPECFTCTECGVRLTASPFFSSFNSQTVKASVEEPVIFCPTCGEQNFTARGLVFSPHRTLAGPPGFGTMASTTTAETMLRTTGRLAIGTQVMHAAGKFVTKPQICPSCLSPRWTVYGYERCKCMECGNVF
mmetsp:Transcript_40106/g.89020  ORF Transcript_40106/g.89020 Transcript_40106/m.89020 type:complete len:157 (-) Transcript_40106:720-1190(-)